MCRRHSPIGARRAICSVNCRSWEVGGQLGTKSREITRHLPLRRCRRMSSVVCMLEIRWCPAHEGVEGNEKADEWAKQAAEEPDARGVEWLRYGDQYGARRMSPPRSRANLRREIAEKEWAEARSWAEERVRKRKYRLTKSQRTKQYLQWTKERGQRRVWKVPIQDTDEGTYAQTLQGVEVATEDSVGGSTKGDRKGEGPVHDPRFVRRRAVHQRDPRLPAHHEGGTRMYVEWDRAQHHRSRARPKKQRRKERGGRSESRRRAGGRGLGALSGDRVGLSSFFLSFSIFSFFLSLPFSIFLSFSLSSCHSLSLSLTFFLSFSLSFCHSLSLSSFFLSGQAGRGRPLAD